LNLFNKYRQTHRLTISVAIHRLRKIYHAFSDCILEKSLLDRRSKEIKTTQIPEFQVHLKKYFAHARLHTVSMRCVIDLTTIIYLPVSIYRETANSV